MGIGNADTYKMRQRFARHGHDYDDPEIPELPDLAVTGPSFLVIEGQTNGEAMDTHSQVHDLYRKEGVKMDSAPPDVTGVSIRAPLARGDYGGCSRQCDNVGFNPRLSCEGRQFASCKSSRLTLFQSAPLLRGATRHRCEYHG